MEKLGTKMPPVHPYHAVVLAHMKRRPKAGGLAEPSEVCLRAPSPKMHQGWLWAVMHSRFVACPDPLTDQAICELTVHDDPGVPRRWLHEKGPVTDEATPSQSPDVRDKDTVRPKKKVDLANVGAYELAHRKLVTAIKSRYRKLNARLVIFANIVQGDDDPAAKIENYAGGIDGVCDACIG